MNTPHPKKAEHGASRAAHAQDLGSFDLYEEEISAEKHLRDRGEAQLNKRVVVSTKDITLPVMHEELTVERTALSEPEFAAPAAVSSSFDEIRIPLCEEEATAETYVKRGGEVRLHKRIVATQRQITVPVMHEELRVHRSAATEHTPVAYADGMFESASFVVPLHDEEVEIHKRPVAREGIRLTKHEVREDFTTSTELRREELDIEAPRASAPSWKESRDRFEFADEDRVIPLFKEEVEIRKSPYLREEVLVSREALQEDYTGTTETLKEELEIEQPGDREEDIL